MCTKGFIFIYANIYDSLVCCGNVGSVGCCLPVWWLDCLSHSLASWSVSWQVQSVNSASDFINFMKLQNRRPFQWHIWSWNFDWRLYRRLPRLCFPLLNYYLPLWISLLLSFTFCSSVFLELVPFHFLPLGLFSQPRVLKFSYNLTFFCKMKYFMAIFVTVANANKVLIFPRNFKAWEKIDAHK